MPSSLVTVITPAYNSEKFIEETVQSVLTQGYAALEYILIDDCSTDSTWDIVDRINDQREDCLINYYLRKENHGEQSTVNEGLKLVKGKYFIIVNADDPLKPGAIKTLVDFMESHPDVLCGYPDWDCIDEEGKLKFHVQAREYDFTWMVAHHTWIPGVGSIFRSEVIERIGYRDTSFGWMGDADYWLRLGLAGKMARVPATLATWRYHNGQASGQRSDERARERIRVIQKFYEEAIFQAYPCPENFWDIIKSIINFPMDLFMVKKQAICWSYLVAAAIAKSPGMRISCLFNAFKAYPQLLISPDFWHKVTMRAIFFLRRRV
jgi:glycosyltransferase involved in cell wall biosynthesis